MKNKTRIERFRRAYCPLNLVGLAVVFGIACAGLAGVWATAVVGIASVIGVQIAAHPSKMTGHYNISSGSFAR